MTEKASGRSASGRDRTLSIARFKCFLPIKPLGHSVSEMSSTGITRGDVEVLNALRRAA